MSVKIVHQPRSDQPGLPPLRPVLDQPFAPSPALSRHIDTHWQKMSHESAKRGRDWYNGQLWSPLGFEHGALVVRAGTFKDFVGTRHLPDSVRLQDRISPVSVAILPVVVIKPGGKIISLRFFRRNVNSLDFAGFLSGLGGLMEPDVDGTDPMATAIREVREESGLIITPGHLTYLGLALTGAEQSASYCFLLELTQSEIDGKLVFEDGEMTSSLSLPPFILNILTQKITPAAAWVKTFSRLVLEQHGHRL